MGWKINIYLPFPIEQNKCTNEQNKKYKTEQMSRNLLIHGKI